jgi:hypothetical protein
LVLSAPDDEYEREADRVATEVMRTSADSPPDIRPERARVRRVCATCDDQIRRSPRRDASSIRGETASIESRIQALRGGGQPLEGTLRTFFEPRFGHDFSDVRVHSGTEAAQTAGAIGARAYTIGNDVVFGSGQYPPRDHEGTKLLAHELTHIVQQSAQVRTKRLPITRRSGAPNVMQRVPIEAPGAPVFELGAAALESMEPGTPVEQLGVVQTEDGTNLWPETDRKKAKLGLLPMNTRVFVDRKLAAGWSSVYVDRHQRGKSLPVSQGTHGYVASKRVNTDMPDPDAWLYRITTPGQGALDLAGKLYPDYNPKCKVLDWACQDYRYLVNVLVAVNDAKDRTFVYKEHPSDEWYRAKTMVATKTDHGYVGGQIWVPGMQLVKAMESQVSSGSISLEALTTLSDIVIGTAAFIVGLLEGALTSVADLFFGLVDLIKLVGSIIKKLFKRTLLAGAKAFWEDISKIKISDIINMVGAKWNHPNTWDRWKFRGYVIGYAIVEILMLVFSGGVATAVKWAGKLGKFGKLAEYLGKLPKVQKLLEAAKGLKGEAAARMRKVLEGAMVLSKSHAWAAQVLRIPLGILRRLKKWQIAQLKRLPQWAMERFARLSEKAMLRLLGCTSPCKVDVHAIAEALKLTGKGGTALRDVTSVLRVLKRLDARFKTAKISRKLRKSDSALMTVIKEAKLTDADFLKLEKFLTPGDLESPAQAYRTFVRYVSSVVPTKTGPDIKALNEALAKMMAVEKRQGAALKGPIFEQWVALHITELSSRTFSRTTFNVRKLLGKVLPPFRRQVDTWVPNKGEIWDMKHRFGRVDPGQAADYSRLRGKAAPDGNRVASVNYLFPTKEAAELNRHLRTTYGFNLYYIDETTSAMQALP